MKELSIDNLYLGSKAIWNKMSKYVDISSKRIEKHKTQLRLL